MCHVILKLISKARNLPVLCSHLKQQLNSRGVGWEAVCMSEAVTVSGDMHPPNVSCSASASVSESCACSKHHAAHRSALVHTCTRFVLPVGSRKNPQAPKNQPVLAAAQPVWSPRPAPSLLLLPTHCRHLWPVLLLPVLLPAAASGRPAGPPPAGSPAALLTAAGGWPAAR